MRPLVLVLPLLLAACVSPEQRCINRASEDLRVLSALIEETRGTIERGYAYEFREEDRLRYTICTHRDGTRGFCWVRDERTTRVPVAVNLDDERAKLETLLAKREELTLRTRAEIAACEAAAP